MRRSVPNSYALLEFDDGSLHFINKELNDLQQRYQDLIHHMKQDEYRDKQQQQYTSRREHARKLFQAGKLLDDSGVINVLLSMPYELALEKLKVFADEYLNDYKENSYE